MGKEGFGFFKFKLYSFHCLHAKIKLNTQWTKNKQKTFNNVYEVESRKKNKQFSIVINVHDNNPWSTEKHWSMPNRLSLFKLEKNMHIFKRFLFDRKISLYFYLGTLEGILQTILECRKAEGIVDNDILRIQYRTYWTYSHLVHSLLQL